MIRPRVLFAATGVMIAVAVAASYAGAAGGQTAGAARSAAKKSTSPRCQQKALGISLIGVSPGASHHGVVIEFKNRGSVCAITGYPGVDALNSKGHRVLSAKRTKSGYLGGVASGPIPKVRLAKGKTASSMVEWSDLGPPCPRVHSLKVTAPNAVTSVILTSKLLKSETLCFVQVHPVVPGRTGQKT